MTSMQTTKMKGSPTAGEWPEEGTVTPRSTEERGSSGDNAPKSFGSSHATRRLREPQGK